MENILVTFIACDGVTILCAGGSFQQGAICTTGQQVTLQGTKPVLECSRAFIALHTYYMFAVLITRFTGQGRGYCKPGEKHKRAHVRRNARVGPKRQVSHLQYLL